MHFTDETARLASIHASGHAFVLVVTGGGVSAVARLLAVPGGSRSILEALVPYSSASLDALLGAKPEHYCSASTARAMAMVAFGRARRWAQASQPAPDVSRLIGVACTASLASDREKRGAHRAHIALQTDRVSRSLELKLARVGRSRAEQEELVGEILLQALEGFLELPAQTDTTKLQDDESLAVSTVVASESWRSLLLGQSQRTTFVQNATNVSQLSSIGDAKRTAIFPGAFNPIHDGHRQMAQYVARRYDADVRFELSIENVDKPPLDFAEIKARGERFDEPEKLWLTRAPTFVEKARLFPQSLFIVGADTMERIANPKYYGGSDEACRAAISEIAQRGCRFVVFGRVATGNFQSLPTLSLPERLRDLCDYVSESEFREDISSTEIRKRESAANDDNAAS